jgi:hypothetical protein
MSDYVPASESIGGQPIPPAIPLELREAIGQMATTGAPLDIPPFDSGVLPPFVGGDPTVSALMAPFETTLNRIAVRMCGSERRTTIFHGLLNYRQALAAVGLQDGFQWLSGSFMEDIETLEKRSPRDVDVVTFIRRPPQFVNDDAGWQAYLEPNEIIFDHELIKAQFHCDAYFVDMSTDVFSVVDQTRYWFWTVLASAQWRLERYAASAACRIAGRRGSDGGARSGSVDQRWRDMMIKLDRDHLAAEISAVDHLLSRLPSNDFLGRRGLESRKRELSQRFANLAEQQERLAKVALYFGGDPVIGSIGVQASFATNAVGSFQDLLTKVWGTTGGQIAAMGPIKDKPASQLHITNLVHGSFGFLLEELDEEGQPMFTTPLKEAADQAADYISSFANEDERRFSDVIEQLNPRVFLSLRQFFWFMYRDRATFRMVEGDRDENALTARLSNAPGTALKNQRSRKKNCTLKDAC